jgi:hypothetical protein
MSLLKKRKRTSHKNTENDSDGSDYEEQELPSSDNVTDHADQADTWDVDLLDDELEEEEMAFITSAKAKNPKRQKTTKGVNENYTVADVQAEAYAENTDQAYQG